jgi:hypothetical protein
MFVANLILPPYIMKLFAPPVLAILTIFLLTASCEKVLVNKAPVVVIGETAFSLNTLQDSVFVTGAVADDDSISTYLWTKISGEGSFIIQAPTAVSTWIKNLEAGTYIFQFTATDSHGSTGSDTITITVNQADIDTLTLSPHANPTEVHLFGNNTTIDQTHPDAPELVGGSGTYFGDPVNIRALLKFDLSSIPENATIVSAKLTLYSNPTPLNGQNNVANSGTDNSLYIQRVTSAWDSSGITWLNQPASTSANQVGVPHTDQPFLDLIDIDVTDLVSAMMPDESNNGFLIRLQNEVNYNFRVFCSSKYSDQAKHPKLEVQYVAPL